MASTRSCASRSRFDGAIDPNTANSQNVFLVRLGNLFGAPDGPATVIGINQVVWDPASSTLFVESDQHLDQHTSYLLVVTDGIHDASGAPIQRSPSFDDFRNSLNFGQAKDPQLKLYREILISALNNTFLEAVARVSLKDVVAASVFTTGSVSSTLEKIRGQIKAASAPTVSFNLGVAGQRTVFPIASVLGILFNQEQTQGPPTMVPVLTPALQVFPVRWRRLPLENSRP